MALHQLGKSDARKLCAGQVLGDVVAVVKELLENALDAGAERVELTLRGHGLELLQCRDDGAGLAQDALLGGFGRRYHTSKIASLDGLAHLTTYGFRGEAVNSLCDAASVSVTSRPRDAPAAGWLRVRLDSAGAVAESGPGAAWRWRAGGGEAKHGTSVEAAGLFARLPVRRSAAAARPEETVRRVGALLAQYALARPDARLACHWEAPAEPPFVAAPQPSLAAAVLALYGPDVADALVAVPPRALPFGLGLAGLLPAPQRLAALLRARNDRQFLLLNRRPVDLPRATRLLHARLRAYLEATGGGTGRGKYGFVALLVEAPANLLDVNLSPDKRAVALQPHVEQALLAALAALLDQLYPLHQDPSAAPGALPDEAEAEAQEPTQPYAAPAAPDPEAPTQAWTAPGSPLLPPAAPGADAPASGPAPAPQKRPLVATAAAPPPRGPGPAAPAPVPAPAAGPAKRPRTDAPAEPEVGDGDAQPAPGAAGPAAGGVELVPQRLSLDAVRAAAAAAAALRQQPAQGEPAPPEALRDVGPLPAPRLQLVRRGLRPYALSVARAEQALRAAALAAATAAPPPSSVPALLEAVAALPSLSAPGTDRPRPLLASLD